MLTDLKLKVWKSETRPNTGVAFWERNAEDEQHMDVTYRNTSLLLAEETSFSDDQLTRTRTQLWEKVPGLLLTRSQDTVLLDQKARNATHNEQNGISSSPNQYQVLDAGNTVLVHGQEL